MTTTAKTLKLYPRLYNPTPKPLRSAASLPARYGGPHEAHRVHMVARQGIRTTCGVEHPCAIGYQLAAPSLSSPQKPLWWLSAVWIRFPLATLAEKEAFLFFGGGGGTATRSAYLHCNPVSRQSTARRRRSKDSSALAAEQLGGARGTSVLRSIRQAGAQRPIACASSVAIFSDCVSSRWLFSFTTAWCSGASKCVSSGLFVHQRHSALASSSAPFPRCPASGVAPYLPSRSGLVLWFGYGDVVRGFQASQSKVGRVEWRRAVRD
jgi:hypothetical protein